MVGLPSGRLSPGQNPFQNIPALNNASMFSGGTPLSSVQGLGPLSVGKNYSAASPYGSAQNPGLLPSRTYNSTDSFNGNTMASSMGYTGMPGMANYMPAYNPPISGSIMNLMANITSMMASVMTGLMQFIQVLLTQRTNAQSQQNTMANAASGMSTSSTTPVTPAAETVAATTEAPKTTKTASTETNTTESTGTMTKLAASAEKVAKRRGTNGKCLAGVQDALVDIGIKLERKNSAYMMLPILRKDSRFKEIPAPKDLTKLPKGAIVVWDRTSKNIHGHISVALGDGREASDHIQKQITRYSTPHVFLPQ